MDRTTGREQAETTLTGLGIFAAILGAEPESFNGNNPVAVVHSKSLAILQDARGDFTSPAEIFVTIYVKRERTASQTDKDAIEDTLDRLTRAAIRALWNAFYEKAANLQIGPSEAGYPQRQFDDSPYRMERFAVRFDDDAEE